MRILSIFLFLFSFSALAKMDTKVKDRWHSEELHTMIVYEDKSISMQLNCCDEGFGLDFPKGSYNELGKPIEGVETLRPRGPKRDVVLEIRREPTGLEVKLSTDSEAFHMRKGHRNKTCRCGPDKK